MLILCKFYNFGTEMKRFSSIPLLLLASLLAVNIGQAAAGFNEDVLAAHNAKRALHGAPAMTLDSSV